MKTHCEEPIAEFEYRITTDITVQLDEWKEALHTYIRTDENFNVHLQVSAGHPVTYRVDWDSNIDNITDQEHLDEGESLDHLRLWSPP